MKIAVATLLLVLMSNAYAFDESGRAAWISKRVLQLREVQDVKKIPLAGFAKSNDEKNKQGLYRYYAKRNGRVDFKDGTWVIFTSHSAHSEEGRREVIGDVTVARTSTGKLYVCYGHCCSRLALNSPKKIESIADFIEAKGLVPEGEDGGWIEYKKQG